MKTYFLVIISTLITLLSIGQSNDELAGRYSFTTKEGKGEYEFFIAEGKVWGILYSLKGDKISFSIEKELEKHQMKPEGLYEMSKEDFEKYLGNLIVFNDFKKTGNQWKGFYKYGKNNEEFIETTFESQKDKIILKYKVDNMNKIETLLRTNP